MDNYDISAAFEAIEDELIKSMMANMTRHKLEEKEEGMEWSMWQAEQLKNLEIYKKHNNKKYPQEFAEINTKIEKLIRAAGQKGGMEQEIEILNAIKKGFKGYKHVSSTIQGEFFKINERKLNSLIKATISDMEKAETAVLRMANDKYRKIIFNAQVYANTGAGTYEKAIDMAAKDMLAAGLNCVEYKNGARHTLENYARMAIQTASKRAYLQGEGEKRKEWGISLVIMNKRGNPCPKCLPFVGKILIDDVWSGGSSKDGNYPLMSNAIAKGLYHPNCKDGHTTYFEGLSKAPDDKWTLEEIENIENIYKQEQKENYVENQINKFKRLEKYSLSQENKKQYKTLKNKWKNQEWHDAYVENSRKTDLTENPTSSKMKSKGETMSLEYQRYGRNKETLVNSTYINSGEYRNKFDNITDKKEVNRVLYSKAKEMLQHRSGTMLEDMYWINKDTGKVIASALNEKIEGKIIYSNSLKKTLLGKQGLIAMHTHPQSMPPSVDDFNSAFRQKYALNFVLCHDGKIFGYSSNQEISKKLYTMYIGKYLDEGFKEYEAQIKTLEKLKETYDIDFWEVK